VQPLHWLWPSALSCSGLFQCPGEETSQFTSSGNFLSWKQCSQLPLETVNAFAFSGVVAPPLESLPVLQTVSDWFVSVPLEHNSYSLHGLTGQMKINEQIF
jgi:hypothetical protein